MARDRKRAKQRQRRRDRTSGPDVPASKPFRADLPGSLDHASSDVDEFDAAIIRGAQGEPATPPDDVVSASDDEIQESESPSERVASGAGGAGGKVGEAIVGSQPPPSGAPLRGGNRAIGFLRSSWAELQRVQWPDRRQVFQATAVVLGFVAVAGAYLGAADWVAQKIVNFIL